MHAPIRVAIVGGGLSGLTAAYRLQRAGASVTVLEAREWVGGRMRTDPVDGYRVDTGAQLFASMYTRLLALARHVGLGERVARSPGRDALWRDGRAYEVTYGSVASMLASGGVGFGLKMRLGATYLPFLTRHHASLDLHAPERAAEAGLDAESIAAWGQREIGREFVELLAYPQLAAYFGALPEETSAGFYHLLARYGVDVSVYAVAGGAGGVCEALAERVRDGGGALRPGTRVVGVQAEAGGVRVAGEGWEEAFDGVVVALPAPDALDVLVDPAPTLRAWLQSVAFRPALTVGLLLDRPVGVRYFGLSFPRSEARSVAAACVQENKVAGLVPSGRGLLVAFARPDVAASLIDAEAPRVVDAMLADLERAYSGLGKRVTRARLYRWRVGNPVFRPGHLGRLGEFRRGGVEGGAPLVLAGDYLYSASAEGAVQSGDAAASRLLERLGLARRPGI